MFVINIYILDISAEAVNETPSGPLTVYLYKILFSLNLSLSNSSNWTEHDFCTVNLSFQSDCSSCGEAESTERMPTGGTDLDILWNLFLEDRDEVSIIFSLKQ